VLRSVWGTRTRGTKAAISHWAFESHREIDMTRLIFCAAVAALALSSAAEAKGCIKGAIVGGVAGHFAGHHGTVGAVAGCVIGRHEANKADANRDDRRNANPRQTDDGKI
jgi:outer membrane lipoprotein SlyB